MYKKEWLVTSTFVLYTSPIIKAVICPAQWYIQSGFKDCSFIFHINFWSHFVDIFLYSFGIILQLVCDFMRHSFYYNLVNLALLPCKKLIIFNSASCTTFLHNFLKQSTLVGTAESFNLIYTTLSNLNWRAEIWLQTEAKQIICVQLIENSHLLYLFNQTNISYELIFYSLMLNWKNLKQKLICTACQNY